LSGQRYALAVREVSALAGIQESFGKAAERTLHKLAGLGLSESTVQRVTESAGAKVAQMLAAGKVFGPACPWSWHKDTRGKTCAYVSVDWTGILMQGAHAAKTEGRMVAVGMVFNPQPRSVSPICVLCTAAIQNNGTPTGPSSLGLPNPTLTDEKDAYPVADCAVDSGVSFCRCGGNSQVAGPIRSMEEESKFRLASSPDSSRASRDSVKAFVTRRISDGRASSCLSLGER
jgi:hypothetical protein